MSFVGANKADVIKNRKAFLENFGVDASSLVLCQQVHGDNIHVVTKEDIGRGSGGFEDGIPKTDALITNISNIPIAILVADCVPIIFYDKKQKVVGITHAGWRGTMKNITGKTVQKIVNEFKSDPKNILAAIGPSIGPNCFEVGEDVVTAAKDNGLEDFLIFKNSKTYFDLWRANKEQLLLSGISPENIEISGVCNHCGEDYYSFRRDKDSRRFIVGVMMKGQ